jgi:transposase InsO family protein
LPAAGFDLNGVYAAHVAATLHPDSEPCQDAIKVAVAARGGREQIAGVIFHSDRESTYTASGVTVLCSRLGTRQFHRRARGPVPEHLQNPDDAK